MAGKKTIRKKNAAPPVSCGELPNNQLCDDAPPSESVPPQISEETAHEDINTISESTAKDLTEKLNKIEWLSAYLEKMRLADYVMIMSKPKRLVWVNFLAGIARGLGFTIGFTLLGALMIYFVNQLKILDLPLIGDFISELLEYINMNRGTRI